MDAETQSQINDLVELRETHRRRLKILKLAKATTGIDTQPSVTIEIEAIESQVIELDKSIGRLHASEATWLARILPAEPGAPASTPVEIDQQLGAIGRYIFSLEDGVHKDVSGIYRLIEVDRDNDKIDRKLRRKEQDRNTYIIMMLLAILILAVVLS